MVVYRVSRIQAATVTESQFERQPDFDLAAFWKDWCAKTAAKHPPYPVTLRISWEAIPLLPRILGERANLLLEQASPPDAEGAVILNLTFESFEAACSQVIGFGSMVEVLEPAELRDKVIEQATKIIAFYAKKATSLRSETS
jgi:predicted DNA-binding transcriptional regulator YafY